MVKISITFLFCEATQINVRLVCINSHSNISQRSWVEIPYVPDFFPGLISTTSSVVFIAASISYIRFFTAVHIYDFHISTIIRANCLGDLTQHFSLTITLTILWCISEVHVDFPHAWKNTNINQSGWVLKLGPIQRALLMHFAILS